MSSHLLTHFPLKSVVAKTEFYQIQTNFQCNGVKVADPYSSLDCKRFLYKTKRLSGVEQED